MGINIKIFYPEVQRLVKNEAVLTLHGATVGECLHNLVDQYPGAQKWIFNNQGQLLKQVYVYVNAESLRKADLNKAVTDRDTLILVVLVTGG